ncbi:hypothetical protein PTI98_004170 [Pleurotus ostreatus]|nr:hypothetical protein PTI98_004170 [Pleurotus ostreatus]
MFRKAELLGTVDTFMDEFFSAWIEHFKEMEYLTAGSDIQIYIQRRMVKVLREKMKEILVVDPPSESALLDEPSSITIRRASESNHINQGPQRHDPTAAYFKRGLLPRPSGSKRRRELLDAAVIRPKILPHQRTHFHIEPVLPHLTNTSMGKEKKKRRIYVHEPDTRTFVATRATQTRLQHTFIEAPDATEEVAPPPLPSTPSLEFDLGPSNEAFTGGDMGSVVDEATLPDTSGLVVKAKPKRYLNTDAPLLTWKAKYRQKYLEATLILEGRGRHNIHGCTACGDPDPCYRCLDCHGSWLYCSQCMLELHQNEPLHFIERWTDDYFEKYTLRELGLRLQLGHPRTVGCPMVKRGHVDFVVIHDNGIHLLNVDFCGCPDAIEPYEQLLEVGWWPSSPLEPQTATTFQLLRLFHNLNLQGCIPSTNFYRALEQLHNGDGLFPPPDRLQQFMLTVREWRHIRMAKRAGRGNDPTGLHNTGQGELAVPCRSCPHPGINLPEGWEQAPPDIRWLYGLLLQEDANFKQKNRLRSTDNRDPALGPGWATFVSEEPYFAHLSSYVDQEEINHCVGFAALWSANTRRSKGLRATGIGSVSCARSDMFRPNGIGDLQKGERYANMDYIFLSSVATTSLLLITITYDIAC